MIRFSKILCPTDFSEDSECLFDYAIYFAKLQKGKLYILHVLTQDYSSPCLIPSLEVGPLPEIDMRVPVAEELGEEEVRQRMFEAVQRSRKEGLIVEDLFSTGKPYSEILRISKEREIDLIIMGNHKKSNFERRVLGGTIEKVVHKASCPVFIVRRTDVESATVPITLRRE